MANMSKTVLVTGGAGYIGSACVDALIKRGDSVVVFDNLVTGQAEKIPAGALFIEGDVTDGKSLEEVFANHRFDSVLHFAALKAVGDSETEPGKYFHNNVVGTLNLLDVMGKYDVPHIVFSSTAAVYDPEADVTTYIETAPTAPCSVYGQTKLITEKLIQEYVRTKVIKRYSILRYFNVAGDAGLSFLERDAKNVFPVLLQALEKGQAFKIFGTDYPTKDGTCVRDYIHLSDLISAHLSTLDSDDLGIYNLGTSNGYTVRELISAFEQVSEKKLIVEEAPRRAGDAAVALADATKAREQLGWQPKKTLTDMVESTLAIYKS